MKITNKFGLPKVMFDVLSKVYPQKPNRLSVTRLIDSPYLNNLLTKHWDELEEDVSDKLWALLGKSVHYVLEKGADLNSFAEEKIEIEYNGVTIAGITDNYHEKIISDYKVTSVWHWILGDGKDYENQLNCNAWLWRKKGYEVTGLVVHAILRDWQQSKAGEDYPPIPFATRQIPLWTFEQQTQYIEERIKLHTQPDPPPCTPEERWEKKPTFAVMKKGRKSALRVLDTKEQAEEWMSNEEPLQPKGSSNLSIVERKGGCIRCESYCPVRNICPANKEQNNGR
jgi:hypothetical protein